MGLPGGEMKNVAMTNKHKPKANAVTVEKRPVNLGRHEHSCTICAHPERQEIEGEFCEWKSASEIAREHRLGDRRAIYPHAHAVGLFWKRDRNLRAALARIIEKAGSVRVNGATVVAAVQAYAKINAAGQWVERSEHINLNELFDRMTRDELERYATKGELPEWFRQVIPDTACQGPENANETFTGR